MKTAFLRILATCLLLAVSFSIVPRSAQGSAEPDDYATFLNTPYQIGPNTITVYYDHPTSCTMYIDLRNTNDSVVQTWTISRSSRSGTVNYSATYDGEWSLYCRVQSWNYFTDKTRDKFNIADPHTDEHNLAGDYARHPDSLTIYNKALQIIGNATSSYDVALAIKTHVRNYFLHQLYTPGNDFRSWWQPDLTMLGDLNLYGHYYGVCFADSCILTGYARALGIPARVIHLEITLPDESWDSHYFAEFYVLNGTQYQWISVDGDPCYDWFGLPAANARLHQVCGTGSTITARYIEHTITGHYDSSPTSYTGENYYTTDP